MKPSQALVEHREEVLAILAKYPVSNPRIFGSVARGEDTEGSDIDMLIEADNSITYFQMARLTLELEAVLNCKIDLGEDSAIKHYAKKQIFADARAL